MKMVVCGDSLDSYQHSGLAEIDCMRRGERDEKKKIFTKSFCRQNETSQYFSKCFGAKIKRCRFLCFFDFFFGSSHSFQSVIIGSLKAHYYLYIMIK